MKISAVFCDVDVPCSCYSDHDHGMSCPCGADERVLRAYISGLATLPPMTPEQREWCLNEIASVEGYDRKDYEPCGDAEMASGVLGAWVDYCRDKGLL